LLGFFLTQQPSTFAYARQIIKKEGLGFQGLNKGLTATLGRHGIFNMVYFGFYHNVKNIIPSSKVTIQSFKFCWVENILMFVASSIEYLSCPTKFTSIINLPPSAYVLSAVMSFSNPETETSEGQ
jgi:hypothetical protein